MISIVRKPILLKPVFVFEQVDIHFVVLIVFLLMLVSNLNKFFRLNVVDNIHEHGLIENFIKFLKENCLFLFVTFMNIFSSSIFSVS